MEKWEGDCEWCGEKSVTLVADDNLPEWTEGVACERCHKSMIEDQCKHDEIEYQQQLDRAAIALDEL